MNVQEIITKAKQLNKADRKQVLSALETDIRSHEIKRTIVADKNATVAKTTTEMRRRRMAWLMANRAIYGGQYVVLDGDHLLGVARTFREGRELAHSSGFPGAFVDYLSKPDEEGEMGGW